MKKYLIALSLIVFAMSCNHTAKNKVEATDAETAAAGNGQELALVKDSSIIHWKGSKVGGSHHGTLAIKEGEITVKGDTVVSGSFVIDMNSITDEDLTDKSMNEKLVSHLKSEDFFDVAKYPDSKFTITKVEDAVSFGDSVTHMISGNLKLKDVEKNITFGAKVTKEGEFYKAVTPPFTIDRTQWNVKYGSKTFFDNLKDNVVDDNIELQITIVTKAAR